MNVADILTAIRAGESSDWEFKAARTDFPNAAWDTISAMANTDGGVIILGVREKDGVFNVEGVQNPAKIQQDFWNNANNRQKINRCPLYGNDVSVETVEGKQIIVLRVPRASRKERPIYLGTNPLEGTFRRFNEGDYRCPPDEVGRMLADQSEQPADARILEHFGPDDLDEESVRQYRNTFAARSPTHPWSKLDTQGLLEKLGGWRKDRVTNQEGLTVAGLLMFGKDEVIRDPNAIPQYHVDYREKLNDNPDERWTDRFTIDGTWVANLFQFYLRVSLRLPRDVIKTPFALSGGVRIDDTLGHQALREVMVNALIHADYRGMGGIVIEKRKGSIELSNPGSMLISIDQAV